LHCVDWKNERILQIFDFFDGPRPFNPFRGRSWGSREKAWNWRREQEGAEFESGAISHILTIGQFPIQPQLKVKVTLHYEERGAGRENVGKFQEPCKSQEERG
jgi:hypothetical protein